MATTDEEALARALDGLPGWQRHGDNIWKTYQFDDFATAALFVGRVADATAAAGHQPDIAIRGGRVTLTADGKKRLERLAASHLEELDRLTSRLHTLWAGLDADS